MQTGTKIGIGVAVAGVAVVAIAAIASTKSSEAAVKTAPPTPLPGGGKPDKELVPEQPYDQITLVPGHMGTLHVTGKTGASGSYVADKNLNVRLKKYGVSDTITSITSTNPAVYTPNQTPVDSISAPIMHVGPALVTFGWTKDGKAQKTTMNIYAE